MKSSTLWYITPCSPVNVNQRQPRKQYNVELCLLSASCWFLAWITLQPEDGGDMFLRNVAWLSPDYTALYLRKHDCLNIQTSIRIWAGSFIRPCKITVASASKSYGVAAIYHVYRCVLQCRNTTITRGPGRASKYGPATTRALSGRMASPLVTNDEPPIYVINISRT
jgi:hypothetical protein